MLKPLAEMPAGPHPANPEAEPAGWSQACPSSQSPQRCLAGHEQPGSRRDGIFQPARPIFLDRPSSACGVLGRGPWGWGWGVNRSCPTAANKTRPSHAPSIFCDHTRMHPPRCASRATTSPGGHTGWDFPLLPFRSSLVVDVTLSFPHVQPVPPLSGPKTHVWGRAPWCGAVLASRRARAGTVCPAPLTQLLSVRCASCPPLPLPCLVPALWLGHPWARSLKSLVRPHKSLQAPFR